MSVLGVLSLFLSTWVVTSLRSVKTLRWSGASKTPVIVPYLIPGAGNLFAFGFDTYGFVTKVL